MRVQTRAFMGLTNRRGLRHPIKTVTRKTRLCSGAELAACAKAYYPLLVKTLLSTQHEETAQFIAGIGSLKQIDGVISAQCGEISTSLYPSYNDRTKGYTHSLVVVLKDSASLQRYDSSPFHEKIKQDYILPLIDKTAENPYMAFDYLGKLPENESDNSNCCKVQCSYHWVTALAVFAAAGYAFLRYKSRL